MTSYSDVIVAIRATASEPAVRLKAERGLQQSSAYKNDYVASKGGRQDDAVDIMLQRMPSRREGRGE